MKSQKGGDLLRGYFFKISGELVIFWFFDFSCKKSLRRGGRPNPLWVGDLPFDAISTALDHACG